jgi:hypothetical protein
LPKRTLSFYWQPKFLRSPFLSPHGLPVYAKDLALAYANASSQSSSIFPPRRCCDIRVYSYFELSASESDNH